MPATSPEQKRLACMALNFKRHGESALRDVDDKEKVRNMAKMSEEDLEHYCKEPVGK